MNPSEIEVVEPEIVEYEVQPGAEG